MFLEHGLGYSDEYKLLLQATRPSRDMLNGEEGTRMIVYDIRTNNKIWDQGNEICQSAHYS